MQQGLLGRISRTSIMEYHAFGIISEGRHSPYHYMICGVQGDFTRNLVAKPPTSLWTRELKFGKGIPSLRLAPFATLLFCPLFPHDISPSHHYSSHRHIHILIEHVQSHTNNLQPASATHPPCSPVASVSVPAPASVPRSPRASSHQTGS